MSAFTLTDANDDWRLPDRPELAGRPVTTLDVYSHVTDTMQEEAATRLDDALGGAIRALPVKIGGAR